MKADVTSIPALREWHASFNIYREEITEAMSGVQMEIRRGESWVEEQLKQWSRAVRECEEDVLHAKNELAQRRIVLPGEREPDITDQIRNLRRAEARLEHAQEKVKTCRTWVVRLPKIIDETYFGASRRTQTHLEGDVASAADKFVARIEALERYAETKADFGASPSSSLGSAPASGTFFGRPETPESGGSS